MITLKKILDHIFSFAIFSIAFLLPGFPRITGFCIGVLIILWLSDGNFRSKLRTISNQPLALWFISLYAVYLLGMIATSNISEGGNNLILKFSILIFPLILFSPGRFKVPELTMIIRFFILGCLFASIILLSVACYTFLTTGAGNFTYSDLTTPLNIQPAVFSMYLIFCVFALLEQILSGKKKFYFIYAAVSWLLICFFVSMIFLLSARQEIIAFLLLLPAMLLFYFFNQKKRMLGIGLSAAIVGGLLLIMFLIPETKMRLEKMQSQMDETYSNEAPNSVTLRKVIWESAFEIIGEHWLTGVGTGDANDELKNRYKEKQLIWPLNDNLNAHNQYLQTAIAVGIPGLLVFIASLIAALRVAFIKNEYLYALFLALFIFCIITECMLEEEAGVVFFAYFNSLLAIKNLDVRKARFT